MSERNSRVKRHLHVFIVTLFIVLLTGMLAMGGYSVLTGRDPQGEAQDDAQAQKDGQKDTVIDFSWLGQQTDIQPGSAKTPADEPETAAAPDIPDGIQAENERLYNEAVGKGQKVKLADCADSGRVTVVFAGDVLLDDSYAVMGNFRQRGSDISDTFSAGLLEKMRGADVFMLNNEFPFSTRGTPTEGKTFTFRANPSNVELYVQMGADLVSLANNHAYDYGEEALLDTFATLEGADIPYVGAGRNAAEAQKPVYIVANGMKIAIVGATQIERNATPDTKEATSGSAGVLRCMDPSALLEVIAEAKSESDFVILYIHWGTELEEGTDWLQDKQAPIYAEAGADLIIGAHPHCLQKLDAASGVPVAYSLGNFWFNSKTQDSCLVEVGIQKGGLEYFQFIPCRQENSRTRLLDGAKKAEALDYMRGLSPNVVIDEEGYVRFSETRK